MNSVLLIGNEQFTASVTRQVRSLDALTVMAVTTAAEAVTMMEKAVPDVVIVQASLLIDGSVLKTFSHKRHSVYFVVLDEPSTLSSDPRTEGYCKAAASSTVPMLSVKAVEGLSELYIEKKVNALESGADAYVWLLPVGSSQDAKPLSTVMPGQSFGKLPYGNPPSGQRATQTAKAQVPITFRPSQRRLIQAYIRIGLDRAQRHRDLSRINDWLSAVALVDALTQLSNRRAFDLELPRQIKVAHAKATPLSLMVLDIDYFKSVNDRYGHLVGDDVLKLLAKRLLANMRFYDTPFRYGGEEFVVTLSNTDIEEATVIAQRLRQSIAQQPFDLTHLIGTSSQLPVTISIGLTELTPGDDEQGRSFLHRADQNLLKAKGAGRDQVVGD